MAGLENGGSSAGAELRASALQGWGIAPSQLTIPRSEAFELLLAHMASVVFLVSIF